MKTLLKIHHWAVIYIPRLFPQVDLPELEPGGPAAVLSLRSLFLTLPFLTITVTSKPEFALQGKEGKPFLFLFAVALLSLLCSKWKFHFPQRFSFDKERKSI